MYKLKNRKKYIAHYSKEKRLASLALYQLSRLRQAYKLAQSFWGPDIRPGETKPVNEKRRKDYITQQVLQTLKEYRMGNPNKKRRIVARKAKLMREGLTPDGEALNVVSNDNSQKKDFEPHRKAVIEVGFLANILDFFGEGKAKIFSNEKSETSSSNLIDQRRKTSSGSTSTKLLEIISARPKPWPNFI